MLGLNPNSAMADGGASNPLQEIQMRLQAPTAWMHGVIKGAQQSVEKWGFLLQSGRGNSASRIWSVAGPKDDLGLLKPVVEAKVEPSFQERLERQLAAWRRNSAWVDEVPALEVTVPKGTLCKFDSRFELGIPPDAVYNILTDPNNKRVFKNIQEVKYRKVLEDDGNRQLVELEQLASWRFLWLSGTLSACVLVDQDRSTHVVKYRLAKTGFMKRFEGTWKIEPLYIDESGAHVQAPESGTERVASVVTLQQLWQSVIVPPPPFGGYVRGITTRTTVEMMQELQTEAKRLREGTTLDDDNFDSQDLVVPEKVVPLVEQWKLLKRSTPGRRKSSRKSQWRNRSE
ncbi:hypothetical protein KC19_9G105000 [Ceratodon purpureus]|uniref:DUF220 domain-containing protein n=1 Tax=Ceratodon purpureus TaxID=3225 RepID=A0A8T0GUY4_CERPU|nr:hypothetical protein KC19_9G105000 [Ceratodon purpureus]